MSERLRQGLQLRNKSEIGVGPQKGRTKQGKGLSRGQNSHTLTAAVRATVSVPAAPGRQENRQGEAEA